MRPAKTQISLRIRQSDQNLRYPYEETLYPWLSKMRTAKIQIRLRESESSLGAHVGRYVFRRCSLYIAVKKQHAQIVFTKCLRTPFTNPYVISKYIIQIHSSAGNFPFYWLRKWETISLRNMQPLNPTMYTSLNFAYTFLATHFSPFVYKTWEMLGRVNFPS